MKRLFTLTALVLLAFTSAARGQVMDTTSYAVNDTTQIEVVMYVQGTPTRAVFMVAVAEHFDHMGHEVAQIGFLVRLSCQDNTLEVLAVRFVDVNGMWSNDQNVPNLGRVYEPSPGSADDEVLTFICTLDPVE